MVILLCLLNYYCFYPGKYLIGAARQRERLAFTDNHKASTDNVDTHVRVLFIHGVLLLMLCLIPAALCYVYHSLDSVIIIFM